MTTDFLIGAVRASRDLHPQVKTELEEILHRAGGFEKNVPGGCPVITCKDCANWHINCLPSCGRHGCDIMGDFTGPDDYCKKAVLRT